MTATGSTQNLSRSARSLTDLPATKDGLGLDRYVNGLSAFIKTSATPLTIAIQGDWGSGKTTTMNLIENQLNPTPLSGFSSKRQLKKHHKSDSRSQVYTITLNTWHYSQLSLDGSLPLMLLQALVSSFSSVEGVDFDKVKRTLGKIAQFGVFIGSQIIGDNPIETHSQPGEQDFSAAELLEKLRSQLTDLVNTVVQAGTDKESRIVIFIDDLDRLEPARAVEVMEALKVFLDLEHCVFVLAIDFDVVAQGVKAKYGESIDDQKARSFFDKIIQVPFHMPMADFKLDLYLNTAYASAGLQFDDEVKRRLASLIEASVGKNPRSIKRLLNTFVLLRGIHADSQPNAEHLFALLCLQVAFPGVHTDLRSEDFEDYLKYLLKTPDEIRVSSSDLEAQFDLPPNEAQAKLQEWGIDTAAGSRALNALATEIRQVFAQQKQSDFDMAAFLKTLDASSVTSVGEGTARRTRTSEKEYDRNEQRALVSEKYEHYDPGFAFQIADELFRQAQEVLTNPASLQMGVRQSEPRDWIFEFEGRRVGSINLRASGKHKLNFDFQQWMRVDFAEAPGLMLHEYASHSELTRVFNASRNNRTPRVIEFSNLQRAHQSVMPRLVALWLEQLRRGLPEEAAKQTETQESDSQHPAP